MDFLSNFDVEADLQTGEGTLYSPRNCPSARPDWNVRSNIVDFAPSAGSGRLLVEVELDGRKVIATLDTGSSGSIVSTAVAHALGVTDEMLAKDRLVKGHGIAEKDADMHAHRFDRLRIGLETAANPYLLVADLPSKADDVLLGMNYLRNRKIWISASSRRIHISAPLPARAKPPT
jgi:predicted aspartyl protease